MYRVGYYININNSYRAIFLLWERRYPKLTGRRREDGSVCIESGGGGGGEQRVKMEGVGCRFNQSGVRDILAIKPVNIFYTGGVRLQRCTKDGYGLSIFLKYHRRMYNLARPRLNARGRRERERERVRRRRRRRRGVAKGGEDWNLWQLFATGFLRYQRAIH